MEDAVSPLFSGRQRSGRRGKNVCYTRRCKGSPSCSLFNPPSEKNWFVPDYTIFLTRSAFAAGLPRLCAILTNNLHSSSFPSKIKRRKRRRNDSFFSNKKFPNSNLLIQVTNVRKSGIANKFAGQIVGRGQR